MRYDLLTVNELSGKHEMLWMHRAPARWHPCANSEQGQADLFGDVAVLKTNDADVLKYPAARQIAAREACANVLSLALCLETTFCLVLFH